MIIGVLDLNARSLGKPPEGLGSWPRDYHYKHAFMVSRRIIHEREGDIAHLISMSNITHALQLIKDKLGMDEDQFKIGDLKSYL
ncbi:hypothetical protein FNV43_RR07436 [Rhamnella rubrinervis]|uniref:Uncharacterized protein n=1 Tax=Rhamnella rubrinervis TaxID=2594499 RepID=A0A8K0MM68_9ROSA|nr:hypothetical protein FNV43_RR07436 [Rhamnella rubrinervis]